LQIRLPVDLIPFIYESLAGQTFSIGQNQFQLGIPEYNPLHPFPDLYSRLVIIKRFQEPQSFLEAAKRQLERLGIQGTIALTTRANGQPQCRQLTIENKTGTFPVKGFGVQVTDLSTEDSITLQKYGIGGKQKMMCGVFVLHGATRGNENDNNHATQNLPQSQGFGYNYHAPCRDGGAVDDSTATRTSLSHPCKSSRQSILVS
jgi:CRISPR-associated protein Cas6